MSHEHFKETESVFEDAEDLLDFVYEKIEDAVYFWSLWSKIYLPDLQEVVLRQLLVEYIERSHSEIHRRYVLVVEHDHKKKEYPGLSKLVLKKEFKEYE